MKSRDVSEGAKRCGLLAELVHGEFSKDTDLASRLKDSTNFAWMSQPEVCEPHMHTLHALVVVTGPNQNN